MRGRNERGAVPRFPVGMASILAGLVVGCEGDLPARLMQRDLDTVRSEVAAVSRMGEGERLFVEERLGKLEADLKTRMEKVAQEKSEDVEGFLRSQASVSTKLDELIEGARSTHGRVEEIGHRISELNKRVDALDSQVVQAGRRLDGFEKQLNQVHVTAQEATAVSQQTAQHVTDALQQMADQTNAALQQVNTNTQLALAEAKHAVGGQQAALPIPPQAPAVVKLPPPPSMSPPATAVIPSPPPALPARPASSTATPDELYKKALNDYTRGKYDLAIDGFRTYIILYPNTPLLPNAHYWLGESLYRLRNYGLAIRQFGIFLTEYPDSPKAPGAMLKQGYAHLDMGNTSQGRTTLNNLIKRFPKSREAKLAKTRLSKVKRGHG